MDNNMFNSVVENYHVSICQTERLYEGEGCNYRIADDTGKTYILKVYNTVEEELISFITTILNFLATSDMHIHFPRPVKNISGMDYTRQDDNILVLFHWIDGTTMEFVNIKIAEELGEVVGMLDNTLCEFYQTHAKDYSKYEESLFVMPKNYSPNYQRQQAVNFVKKYSRLVEQLAKSRRSRRLCGL